MPKTDTPPALTGATVLRYVGDRSAGAEVPARDLTDADVARLAWLWSAQRSGTAADTTAEARASVIRSLTATHLYATSKEPSE